MRRKDREVTNRQKILSIMNSCDVCRLGLSDDNVPYVVPVCFAYEVGENDNITLYFHCAEDGRKVDIMKKNPNIAFEMDTSHKLFDNATDACGFGMQYECIMGTGTVRFVTEKDDKVPVLDLIMKHYTKKHLPYRPEFINATLIVAVDVTSISCKVNENE